MICEKVEDDRSLAKGKFEYECNENGDDNEILSNFRPIVPSAIYYSNGNEKWYALEGKLFEVDIGNETTETLPRLKKFY